MASYYNSLINEGYKIYKKEIVFEDVNYMTWVAINESINYYKFYLFDLKDYYSKQIESLSYRSVEGMKLLSVKDYLSNITRDKITFSVLTRMITMYTVKYGELIKEAREKELIDKEFEEWDGVIKGDK